MRLRRDRRLWPGGQSIGDARGHSTCGWGTSEATGMVKCRRCIMRWGSPKWGRRLLGATCRRSPEGSQGMGRQGQTQRRRMEAWWKAIYGHSVVHAAFDCRRQILSLRPSALHADVVAAAGGFKHKIRHLLLLLHRTDTSHMDTNLHV